jgi:hypothetical protein
MRQSGLCADLRMRYPAAIEGADGDLQEMQDRGWSLQNTMGMRMRTMRISRRGREEGTSENF